MEIWANSYIYPDAYEISSYGRVRSRSILVKNSRGNSLKRRPGRILSLSNCSGGYLKCCLTHRGIKKYCLVHRLVAFSFYKNTNYKLAVNHINFDTKDNRLVNLEIVSYQENIRHSMNHGRINFAKGAKVGNSSVNEDKVLMIRRLLEKGLSYPEVASRLQTTAKIVGDINRKRTWKHI